MVLITMLVMFFDDALPSVLRLRFSWILWINSIEIDFALQFQLYMF